MSERRTLLWNRFFTSDSANPSILQATVTTEIPRMINSMKNHHFWWTLQRIPYPNGSVIAHMIKAHEFAYCFFPVVFELLKKLANTFVNVELRENTNEYVRDLCELIKQDKMIQRNRDLFSFQPLSSVRTTTSKRWRHWKAKICSLNCIF